MNSLLLDWSWRYQNGLMLVYNIYMWTNNYRNKYKYVFMHELAYVHVFLSSDCCKGQEQQHPISNEHT